MFCCGLFLCVVVFVCLCLSYRCVSEVSDCVFACYVACVRRFVRVCLLACVVLVVFVCV